MMDERIKEGDKVTVWFTDKSAEIAIVLHIPKNSYEMWEFKACNSGEIFSVNPQSSTLEQIYKERNQER